MLFSKLALLAGAVGVAAHVAPLAKSPVGSADAVDMASECRLPPALDPYRDGLPPSSRPWGGRNALLLQVKRLQALIRVPSVCYDNLGPIGKDERWKPFDELHRVIWELYPEIPNIFRFNPAHYTTISASRTLEERADVYEHVNILAYYHDVIRNFDESVFERYPKAGSNEEL
ncbi:hypothetical protein MY4038_003176 [Beauveria bassiana]